MTEQKTEEMEEKKKFEVVETIFDDFGFERDEVEGGYDEIFFVKLKTKNTAHFQFSKKIGDKILVDPRTTIQNIDGKMVKIELGSYVYETKEIKTVKFHIVKEIKDKNVLFIVNTSFTQVARSIMNSLLGHTESIKKVNMTVYLNKSGYASVKVSINGKKAMWKYSIDEQRKKIETIKNKRGEFVSNDYTDLDNMFEEKMREHLGVLFPEQDHIKFIPESDVETVLPTTVEEPKDEAIFGSKEDEESDFFNLDSKD